MEREPAEVGDPAALAERPELHHPRGAPRRPRSRRRRPRRALAARARSARARPLALLWPRCSGEERCSTSSVRRASPATKSTSAGSARRSLTPSASRHRLAQTPTALLSPCARLRLSRSRVRRRPALQAPDARSRAPTPPRINPSPTSIDGRSGSSRISDPYRSANAGIRYVTSESRAAPNSPRNRKQEEAARPRSPAPPARGARAPGSIRAHARGAGRARTAPARQPAVEHRGGREHRPGRAAEGPAARRARRPRSNNEASTTASVPATAQPPPSGWTR